MKRKIILNTIRDVGFHYFEKLSEKELFDWIKSTFDCSKYLADICSKIIYNEIHENDSPNDEKFTPNDSETQI